MSYRFQSSQVDVEDFLEALEIENIRQATESEMKFSCPFPGHQHGDQNPSAFMNIESSAWFCQGCKRKGNAVTFLSDYEQISVMEALYWLRLRYGGAVADPDAYSVKDEIERRRAKEEAQSQIWVDPLLPEAEFELTLTDWDQAALSSECPDFLQYMIDRGFEPETLTEWRIGFSETDDRITIPVANATGQLIGMKGRSWNGRDPKYLVLGTGKWDRYKSARVVYGLDRILDKTSQLILVEGELNVVALWQLGYRNAVAVNGSNFSDAQAKLIRAHADSLIVFFDSDESGFTGTQMVCDKLRDYMPLKVVEDHDGDPADAINPDKDFSPEDVEQLISGAMSETKIRLLAGITS